MSERDNYWTRRRFGRRTILRSTGLGAAGIAAYAAVGCGDDDDDDGGDTTATTTSTAAATGTGTAATATASQAVVPAGRIVVDTSASSTLSDFNPLMWTNGGQTVYRDSIADAMIGVEKKDQAFSYYNSLAASWERPNDGLQVTFKIRPDAKFHDGTAVTSADLKFTLDFVKTDQAKHARKSEWTKIYTATETPDAQTAIVKLAKPYPLLTTFNFMFPVISKAHFEKVGFDAFSGSAPLASGPFKFVSGTKGERITLQAVEGHYRKTPFIKDLVIKATAEESTRLSQIETGETDIAYINPANKDVVKGFGGQIKTTDNDTSFWLVFMDPYLGNASSPTNDPRVREAMSKAINRKDITEKLLNGGANPAGSFGNPALKGHAKIDPDPYDINAAKALLESAGHGGGFDIDFSVTAPVSEYVNVMVADWKKIGVNVTVKSMDSGAWLAMVNGKKTQGMYIEPTGANYVDPGQWGLFVLSDGSFSYLKDPELDGWMNGIITGTDDAAREKNWTDIQTKVAKERIYSTLWTSSTHFAVSKRVKSWDPTPGIGYIINLEHAKV
ncbi:MAG: ABC transporter substrate-binding protein [Dehalococcoidia bacterium]|nr:ABC transporter substrate-binding protein [Dehalococcoidia bacterium]